MNDTLYGHGDGFLTRDNGQRLFPNCVSWSFNNRTYAFHLEVPLIRGI